MLVFGIWWDWRIWFGVGLFGARVFALPIFSANDMIKQLDAAQLDLFKFREDSKAQLAEMERTARVRDLARHDALDELERTARERDLTRQTASEDAAHQLADEA